MSIELYGTEAVGRLALRLVRSLSRRLGVSAGQSLLLFIAGVGLLIVGFVLCDSSAWEVRLKRSGRIAFQQMVGGLGMGAVSSPKWCFHAFDPRYESICYGTAYPVPGSYGYCPYDTVVVMGFGEPRQRTHHILLRPPERKEGG